MVIRHGTSPVRYRRITLGLEQVSLSVDAGNRPRPHRAETPASPMNGNALSRSTDISDTGPELPLGCGFPPPEGQQDFSLLFPKPGWQAYNSAAEHLRGLGAALAQFDFARVRTPAEMSVSSAVLEATNCCIGAIVRDLDGASAAGPIIELSRDLSHSIQDARDKFASSGL